MNKAWRSKLTEVCHQLDILGITRGAGRPGPERVRGEGKPDRQQQSAPDGRKVLPIAFCSCPTGGLYIPPWHSIVEDEKQSGESSAAA